MTKDRPDETSGTIGATGTPGLHPLTIHARMIRILAALPAIGKDSQNTQQNFMYRSHDDVLNALNPLLAKWGVLIIPDVLKRETAQRRTSGGSTMYEVNLHVQFTFFGEAGDSIIASAWGEGTDMGDKSTNKAMTMAFKNVIAQAFAVSTKEGQALDTDGNTDPETHGDTVDPMTVLPPEWQGAGNELPDRVADAIRAIDENVDWTETWRGAMQLRWGVARLSELEIEEQRESWARLVNTIDPLIKDGDFPPPDDAEIQAAFSRAWDGAEVTIVRHAAPEPSEEPEAAHEPETAPEEETSDDD